MRKKLPAWILDGLEKAEKEKQKKADDELKEKDRIRKEKEREERRKEKGLGKFVCFHLKKLNLCCNLGH